MQNLGGGDTASGTAVKPSKMINSTKSRKTTSSTAKPQMISTTTEKSAVATTTTDSPYYEIYYSGSDDAYDVDSKL